ncbi:MAG: hypothetical protein ACOX22_01615 [Caldicoprobacterales bacterium]|jgi:hypothetical protein
MRDVTAATLLEETQLISDMIQQSTYENALVALDQAEFQKRYDSLTKPVRYGKGALGDGHGPASADAAVTSRY